MADIIRQAASNFLGDDVEFGGVLDETVVTGMRPPPIMKFPLDLGDNGRPMIHFQCLPHEQEDEIKSVFFPCPQGVSFSDTGEYTTFNLGLIGDFSKALAKGAKDAEKTGDARVALKALQAVRDQTFREFESVGKLGAGIIAARRLGFDDIATEVEFSNKQVMNPRSNTAFSGNAIRNFQFDFKMIGKSPAEVQMIDHIQSTFRKFVYAEKLNGNSSFMLKYPPQWIIRFIDPQQQELDYIPKIFTCYLTGLNTVINSSSNTFRREDLSPYEIDISVQFQETKVLTRNEIEDLRDGLRDNPMDSVFQELLKATTDAVGNLSQPIRKGVQNKIDDFMKKEKEKQDKK